jgi:hypothetical protein
MARMRRSTSTKSVTRGQAKLVIAGKALAFDTSLLIYYIEKHLQYSEVTDDLFNFRI